MRPRRSALYVPASNAKAVAKAPTLPCDVVIFDLEDAVLPSAKDIARTALVAALANTNFGHREVVVRINALNTPWGEADLATLKAAPCDAILLPKVNGAADVAAVATHTTKPLWATIETALGVLNVRDIAASAGLACLVMGTSDLAKDLHAAHTPTRLPLLVSLSAVVLAARAYGLAVLDGVHLNLDDDEGFTAACQQGRELGFDGKTLIHPKTIAAANEAFSPSPAALAEATAIIAAYEKAAAEGQGVAVHNGQLVESLHVAAAKQLLALHHAIKERAP